MKPERRGRIHLGVRMVGSVEPPQQFEVVISQMPPVHPHIEEHEDKNEFRGSRERELVGKPQRSTFRPCDRRNRQPSQKEPRQEAVHDRCNKMRNGVPHPADAVAIVGKHAFERKDQGDCRDDEKQFCIHNCA
jgi:hypothetical protein